MQFNFSRNFMVREATAKMGHHLDLPLNRTDLAYRLSVVVEEMQEMMIAAQRLSDALMQKRGSETLKGRSADLLKEMVDLSYTLDGTAATFGWDFDRAFELVHESNMTKSPSAGPFEKWVKGPDYKEADVSMCLGTAPTGRTLQQIMDALPAYRKAKIESRVEKIVEEMASEKMEAATPAEPVDN